MAFFAAWGLMMIGMALWGMSDGFTTWLLPVWKMDLVPGIFLTLFLLLWYGFILAIMWYSLRPLQRVKITEDQVLICFGPFVLRRMALWDVRTVIRIGDVRQNQGWNLRDEIYNRRRDVPGMTMRLVLSDIPREQLLDMACGVKPTDRQGSVNIQIRRYVRKHIRYRRFWLEWSENTESQLRRYLPAADFIVE